MRKWLCILTLVALCVTLVGYQVAAQEVAESPIADDGAAETTPVEEAKEPATYPISEEKALAIAADHFNILPGTVDLETGFVMSYRVLHAPTADEPYYRVALQWLVDEEGQTPYLSVLDTLTIMSYRPKVAIPA